MLIFFTTALFSQDQTKNSIGDAVYEEYQQNGIDDALDKYKDLKKNNSNEYNWTEWELNRIGYQLMLDDKDMDAAEKVLKYNMEEYPKAANPRDSYADYLIAQGNEEEAKKYLKESIQMAKNSAVENEKTQIYRGSTAKLARLEKEDQQLNFLSGNWNVHIVNYDKGKEMGSFDGKVLSTFNDNNNILTSEFVNSLGETVNQRILVYDALDKKYDMAYIDPAEPLGINLSTVTIKNAAGNSFEMMEEYTNREGLKKSAKHEIVKESDGKLIWTISEQGDDKSWEKGSVWTYNKEM